MGTIQRGKRACLVVAVVGWTAACVPSLHPLYTEEDLVFEEALLGSWADTDDDECWRFERSESKSYVLTFTPEGDEEPIGSGQGRPARFDAHLVQLGDDLFLDLYPDFGSEGIGLGNGLLELHLVSAHTFSRIWIDEDSVRIGMMDSDWLDKALSGGEIEVEHERSEEGILLTAETSELQAFARSIADNSEAFGSVVDLVRQGTTDSDGCS